MPCEARVGSSVGLPRPNVHISYVILPNQPAFELQVDYINPFEELRKLTIHRLLTNDKGKNDGTHNLHLCAPTIWYTFCWLVSRGVLSIYTQAILCPFSGWVLAEMMTVDPHASPRSSMDTDTSILRVCTVTRQR